MRLVSKKKSINSRLMKNPTDLKKILAGTRWKILKEIAKDPGYPAEIAERMDMDPQKVYYHINELRKTGVIKVARTKEIRGATARIYRAVSPALSIILKDDWQKKTSKDVVKPDFLKDFYDEGFNAKIIVGSPDPHGPHNARARDGYYVGDLAMYLGSLTSQTKVCTRLDTEIREKELEENLVILGGPIVNRVMAKVNEDLPVKISEGAVNKIKSELTGKEYSEDMGMIVKESNPWKKDKEMLVIAGNSRNGTKGAIIGLIEFGERFEKKPAKVVEALDLDGDGVADSAEIKE